jgi:hypothetical protein
MKTDDEKLKEIFRTHLEHHRSDAPDFQVMWEKAARINARKIRTWWAIAASITLLIIGGGAMLFNRQEQQSIQRDAAPIASWNEPTRNLMVAQTGIEQTDVSSWTSPTDFLLPSERHQMKN